MIDSSPLLSSCEAAALPYSDRQQLIQSRLPRRTEELGEEVVELPALHYDDRYIDILLSSYPLL